MVDPERRRAPRIELHINTILTAVATAGVVGVGGVLWQTYNEVRQVKETFPLIFSLKSEVNDLRLEIERLKNEIRSKQR